MSKPHKWAKEIQAWADGAEIEIYYDAPHYDWCPIPSIPEWKENQEYRIKPQPKEPQYLYVFRTVTNGQIEYRIYHDKDAGGALLGKIKLETEDGAA